MHLPDLPLEIYSRGTPRADEPLVISEGQGRGQQVVAASERAYRLGVRPGMRVSEAHALAGALRVKARDAAAEREALARLAAWSGRYTSCVSLVHPDALLLEIAGSRKVYGGFDPIVHGLRQGLRELGYTARVSIAPTPLGATWLARAGRETRISAYSALFSALGELPLTCLDLDPEREMLLKGLGLVTLVDCLRLPRDGIARRVGPKILQLLDRAFGRLPDPRAPFVPPEYFRARLGLPAPIATREALLFPLHRLLLELAGFLVTRGMGATALRIVFHSTRSQSTPVSLRLVAPSRDAAHLTGLARERLERLTLAAPAEEIIVEVDSMRPLAPQAVDFFAGAKTAETRRAEMVEQLQARLGRDAVCGVASHPEHRPECAWRHAEPGTLTLPRDRMPFGVVRHGSRPLWLLPAPVALSERDGRPCWNGALALEPERERIESGWWDDEQVARDYFVARNSSGQCFWVFRELHTRRWFLHGVF